MINSKNELVNEVIDFLFQCEILSEQISSAEESKIARGLTEPMFVEELIGILMNYVKCNKNLNFKAMKALYLKLNDLRFDLEYARNDGINEKQVTYK
ncbi:MAG: hypothetical protein FWC26_00605 [Fibromonadales bacterium]|nr:hypothetical protein [Fibromonadales bacterium]